MRNVTKTIPAFDMKKEVLKDQIYDKGNCVVL